MHNALVSNNSLSEHEKLSIMEALDHLYLVKQYQEMGSCAVCKKISLKKCSSCGTFYCSSECQTYDWPRHRLKCSKERESLSQVNSFSSSKRMLFSSSERNLNGRNEEEKIIPIITNRGSPFTALANQLNKKSGKGFNDSKSVASFKIGNARYQSNENISKQMANGLKDYKKINNRDQNRKSPRKPSIMRISPANSVTLSGQSGQRTDSWTAPKAADNISNSNSDSSNSSLPSRLGGIGRMKVIGTCRESPNRYWVIGEGNLEKYEEIRSILSKECESYESIHPKVGFMYGCTYGDEWFRGKVLSVTPEITVHFVDFGNTSKYNLKVFKKLPYQLRSIPGLAFLIEFEDGTPNQYKTSDLDLEKFTVEEIGRTSDGAFRVKVIEGIHGGGQEPNGVGKTEKKSSARLAMNSLKKTSTGTMFFVPGEGTTRYASIVPDDDNGEAKECLKKVLKIDAPRTATIQAEEGDYVLVEDYEGNHQRGKVISKFGSSYCVRLIDCGNVISRDKVYPLPEYLKSLLELGVKIKIEKVFKEEGMKQEMTFFTIEGDSVEGRWPCSLKSDNGQVIAKVLLEDPTEIWQPETIHLKSGSTVEISHIHSRNSLYVRSVDAETEQKFLDMNMEMIQFTSKGKHSPVPPFPGELCSAKFAEDNCFYRAMIKSFDNVKVNVLFVDFGNEQETNLKDIKPLPETLKKIPFLAVKVTLKNVSPKPWNNMIEEYLGKLSSENIELTLTYKNSIENGVILREKVSGVVVNEFVENAKTPKNDLVKKKVPGVLLDGDLTYTTSPPGGVCVLAILYVSEREFESNQTFWATVADVDNFKYVNTELSLEISKHCESVSEPYKPIYRELCLAEYEGSWYRAICAGCEGGVYRVFFVDFGNACEVQSGSIRRMKEEFAAAPALAMNCVLDGRKKLGGKQELIDKVYQILLNRINTLITGVTITPHDDDTFLVKIPEIEAILNG